MTEIKEFPLYQPIIKQQTTGNACIIWSTRNETTHHF